MLNRPAGVSDDALRQALAAHWHLAVTELQYRPVGFGSHHWVVREAAGDSRFLTVDEVGRDAGPLRAALATAVALRAAGCSFVVAPIPTNTGEPLALMGEFAVALYPLIGVRHGLGVSWANLPGGRRSVYSGFASPLRAAWPVNPCPVGGASMLGPRSGARPNDTVIGWGTAYVTRSCWQRGQYSERED